MSFYEKNLSCLRTQNPELASAVGEIQPSASFQVLQSKTGPPILKAGNISFHSLHNPEQEARKWAEHSASTMEHHPYLIVGGLGFGYHIRELMKHTRSTIVIAEPRLDILRCAMENVDLQDILAGCTLCVGGRLQPLFSLADASASSSGPPPLLLHKPSQRTSPDYFERIKGRLLLAQHLQGTRLKVTVVTPIYGGSLPVALSCANALTQLGHSVDVVDNSLYAENFLALDKVTDNNDHICALQALLTSFLAELLMARVAHTKPDFVLLLAQAPITEDVLERLRAAEIPVVYWFVEDYRHMDYWKEVVHRCALFCTMQKGQFFEELEKSGATNYFYLPLACDPAIHHPVPLSPEEEKEFSSSLSHVGAGYLNRQNFFLGLLDQDIKVWGNDWNLDSPLAGKIQRKGARLSADEYVKIFNASKININLHSSKYHKGVDPFGDTVNPRTFELAGCNAFQLVDERSLIPELFEPGEELISFRDLDDCKEKIRYFLDHPEERKAIALKAKERALREHTYEARMEEMLCKLIIRYPSVLNRRSTSRNYPSNLISQAGPDTPLGKYLSQFQKDEELTLSDITNVIKSKTTPLTEPDFMFLLMEELQESAG